MTHGYQIAGRHQMANGAMITGRQIREARQMVDWDQEALSLRANVDLDVIRRAEAVDGTPSVTLVQAGRMQKALERAGVRFGQNGAVMGVIAGEGKPAR